MKSYKTELAAFLISLMASMPIYAFDLSLGNEENSLGIKVSHEYDEPFGKPLPWGPASIRFSGNSLWAADTLKNRIIEYDLNGNYKSSTLLKLPNYSTIGDFCFGFYKDKKVLYVCDADNPIIYIFNSSGKPIAKRGSAEKRTILMKPARIEFFENKIYVLDIGRSNISVYNTDLNQEKAIVTYSKNFAIENDSLIHISTLRSLKCIEWYNLKTGERTNQDLGIPEDTEIDFLFANNDQAYIGDVKFEEGASKAQYQIIQVDKDNNFTRLNTDYPVSFMVRSFIKDKEGKMYQIKFDETKPNKLTIDQLPDNFKESEG